MAVLVVLLTGQAMASMDASILIVASPSIRADLHASGAQLQLVVAMYTIAFAAMVVTGARLGDVIGRRRAFLLGLSVFTLSSLLAGFAPSPDALILARAVQGFSAAVMTPQVLSIIQSRFDGDARGRAIGAYSMILAVGVAAGQVIGGLLVSAHLLAAAWRPALLVNAPVGVLLLLVAPRVLPAVRTEEPRRLDLNGAMILGLAMLALVLPLTIGRDAGWPLWVGPALLAFVALLAAFVALERRRMRNGTEALFDLSILTLPGVSAGITAVLLVMACYAGFLVAVTLHLQDALRFTPLRAGATFAVYALGFATASLTWSRVAPERRERLPVIGPLLMGGALLAVGVFTPGAGWPALLLLFCGGLGHAFSFSPLASRLTGTIAPRQAADLSGLILTASLVGQVVGVTAFVGIYLARAPHLGSAHALRLTTIGLFITLLVTSACARVAVGRRQGDAPAPCAETG
jgi:MFS family permease